MIEYRVYVQEGRKKHGYILVESENDLSSEEAIGAATQLLELKGLEIIHWVYPKVEFTGIVGRYEHE